MSSSTSPYLLTKRSAWADVQAHQSRLSNVHIRDAFADDPKRFDHYHVKCDGLLFDYSKHKIDYDAFGALMNLARECDVEGMRNQLVSGAAVNASENRAVLHFALRGSVSADVDNESTDDYVQRSLARIKACVERVRTNPVITDVVNIGIGGSDLGPRMAYKAMRSISDGPNLHFISNVDGSSLHQRLAVLKPENTMFVIASKTFSTLETITNARKAKAWLVEVLGEDAVGDHVIAVTSNTKAALDFGVSEDAIFDLRDWIGGRFSIWSAIGLPLAMSWGFDQFRAFLGGARAMDEHFLNAPLQQNIPVIMAALGVWYRNAWDYPAHAVLPYSHDLRDFPIYVQQMDMESNGKGVTRDGVEIDYHSSAISFGEAGTNAQHTFMQLMHQAPQIVPSDFIAFARPNHPYDEHHSHLLGNALAQSKALMDGDEDAQNPNSIFKGNRPSSTLIFDQLDAHHFGMLMALYEHKVCVQGALWGINSFDQWGVALGKSVARDITQAIDNTGERYTLDSSTTGLLAHLDKKFIKS